MRILVSACLLGQPVRYDGQAARWQPPAIWERWRQEGRLIPFCAECAAGFPVPRPCAELRQVGGITRVLEQSGLDVTGPFMQGAQHVLDFARQHQYRLAILKENSPSCGVNTVYDGSFQGRTMAGQGVVTALLRQNGIPVFSEHELHRVEEMLSHSGSDYVSP